LHPPALISQRVDDVSQRQEPLVDAARLQQPRPLHAALPNALAAGEVHQMKLRLERLLHILKTPVRAAFATLLARRLPREAAAACAGAGAALRLAVRGRVARLDGRARRRRLDAEDAP
jgi:hypothetical protein